jgi:hypothetical protein
MTFATFVGLLTALLTPTIAIVATYIAWQQWHTNKQKLDLDLYDRRLRIYEEVRKLLSIVVRDATVTTDALLAFRTSVSEADFLFGSDVISYIDTLYQRGLNLWRWNAEYRDSTQERSAAYDHKKVADEMHEELVWFTQQFDPAKLLFAQYLKLHR